MPIHTIHSSFQLKLNTSVSKTFIIIIIIKNFSDKLLLQGHIIDYKYLFLCLISKLIWYMQQAIFFIHTNNQPVDLLMSVIPAVKEY